MDMLGLTAQELTFLVMAIAISLSAIACVVPGAVVLTRAARARVQQRVRSERAARL